MYRYARAIIVKTSFIFLLAAQFAPGGRVGLAQETSGQTQAGSGGSSVSMSGSTHRANPQRTGVFQSKAIEQPGETIWESPKYFTMKRAGYYVGQDVRVATPTTSIFLPGQAYGVPYDFYYSPPVVVNGVAYFQLYIGDGYLYAVDVNSGNLKWMTKRDRGNFSSPAVAGDSLFVGTDGGLFYAIDLKSKREKWRFKTGDKSHITVSPIVVDESVYFASNNGVLYALNAQTGQQRWNYNMGRANFVAAPAIEGDTIYLAGRLGYLYAINLKTGEERWKFATKDFANGLVVADGVVYFQDYKGQIYSVDAKTGQETPNSRKAGQAGTLLAIDDNTIYFGGRAEDDIHAMDATTRKSTWRFETSEPCNSPALAGGIVYVTCDDGKLYALDAKTGKKRWSTKALKPELSAPTVADGAIYFLSDDGRLHAVR
jgi:eukaryotic-like serine/threonine-protein kinase